MFSSHTLPSFSRVVAGLAVALVLSILGYSWQVSGELIGPIFLTALLFTSIIAVSLTFFLVIPVLFFLIRQRWANAAVVSTFCFLIVALSAALFEYKALSGSNSIASGGKVVVSDGRITRTGYVELLLDATIAGSFGLLGGLVFCGVSGLPLCRRFP